VMLRFGGRFYPYDKTVSSSPTEYQDTEPSLTLLCTLTLQETFLEHLVTNSRGRHVECRPGASSYLPSSSAAHLRLRQHQERPSARV
jgi:hypothetical protein